MSYINIIVLIVSLLIVFILSIVLSIFSPLGIGFIIFSIVRWNTESVGLRKTSFIFQIVLTSLTFLLGFLLSLLFVSINYYGLESWIFMLAIIFGVSFVTAIYIGIIIWESKALRRK